MHGAYINSRLPHPPLSLTRYCLPFPVPSRFVVTHLNHRVVELHAPFCITLQHIHRGEGGGGG